jgi:hypothetical protein
MADFIMQKRYFPIAVSFLATICYTQSCPTTRHDSAWGRGGILLLILELGTRWGWVVSVTPRPRFTPEKGPAVQIAQKDGWAAEPVWTQRIEEKSFYLSRGSNFDHPVIQPVASLYTDWATRLTYIHNTAIIKTFYYYGTIHSSKNDEDQTISLVTNTYRVVRVYRVQCTYGETVRNMIMLQSDVQIQTALLTTLDMVLMVL